MAKPTDGLTKPINMNITCSPQAGGKMDVDINIPTDLSQAWVLYKMLGDAIVTEMMKGGETVNPEPERQVKTLDELGMRLGTKLPKLHRG